MKRMRFSWETSVLLHEPDPGPGPRLSGLRPPKTAASKNVALSDYNSLQQAPQNSILNQGPFFVFKKLEPGTGCLS